jgi:hypothetical protein
MYFIVFSTRLCPSSFLTVSTLLFVYAAIVESAGVFLKEHPGLLPRMADDGRDVVSWPLEASRFLGEAYKPLDRQVSELYIVR